MQITLPYGKSQLIAVLADDRDVTVLQPNEAQAAHDPMQVVEAALDKLIGGVTWADFEGAKSAAIAINDKTRPVPHHHLLPALLRRIEGLGIAPENITLCIATGTHPVMPPEEYPRILPEAIIERYPILCHDGYDEASHTYLGETSRGTPVYINRAYMEADLRVVVGNVEPHQFQGFSGGVKSAAIGLAGKATIDHNHAMMMQPEARLGRYDDNPARQDVEEIGRMMGIHLAHNALLNSAKQIVEVVSGEPRAVMQAAMPRARAIYEVAVPHRFDLMLVSPGGHPKDINVYQTQKGMAHAALVMQPGGTMILCAACPEGTGSTSYENWITDGRKHSHDDVFAHFKTGGFEVGPHKAYQISRDAAGLNVKLISELDDDFVRKLLLDPVPDLQSALDAALTTLPHDAKIGVMPSANSTIPVYGG